MRVVTAGGPAGGERFPGRRGRKSCGKRKASKHLPICLPANTMPSAWLSTRGEQFAIRFMA